MERRLFGSRNEFFAKSPSSDAPEQETFCPERCSYARVVRRWPLRLRCLRLGTLVRFRRKRDVRGVHRSCQRTEKRAVPKCGLCVCSRPYSRFFLGKGNEPIDSPEQFLSWVVWRSLALRKRGRAAEGAKRSAATACLRHGPRGFRAGHGG